MNYFYRLFFLLFASVLVFSQDKGEDYSSWSFDVEKITDQEYNLIFTAKIEPKWHIYSQFTPEGGALPLEINFEKVETDFDTIGMAKESKIISEYNDLFETELYSFVDSAKIVQKIKLLQEDIPVIKGHLFFQICKDVCFNVELPFVFSIDSKTEVIVPENKLDDRNLAMSQALKIPLQTYQQTTADHNTNVTTEGSGLFMIFLLGLFGGFLALLTPCVFPMIPLTVSFFTKQNTSKKKGISNAFLFAFFIIAIYISLSIPFFFIESLTPEILNNIATNIWLNLSFFIIFIVFAFSFFGYYELTLPNRWGNTADSKSSGNVLGIFFMALTLAIVSFSCTGPILGSLLVGSLSSVGGANQLLSGMAGFGVALALPFATFAVFPNLLKSLPKSGGWLNTVKVILGFIEIAFAFKFLSNADLVGHWGLLKREVFVSIWAVISILIALYLLQIIRFPHDSKNSKKSLKKSVIAIIFLGIGIYLFLGVFKFNKLTPLSGFAPPEFYSVIKNNNQCPLGLECYKDFETGLEVAKQNNKPIMLDFTGWACVNCRKMEELVWVDESIREKLEQFVIISLYVDDRKVLPKDHQFFYKTQTGYLKHIETVGDKWSAFQITNFKVASQPYYILMSADYNMLNNPIQYTDIETYDRWLKTGLENFKKTNSQSIFGN